VSFSPQSPCYALAAEPLSQAALIATDLLDFLPAAIKEVC